ncbi:MAG: T9SS type A sorting domain-containing protein [Candidatus Latescibacterota bacterium]|nr:MAG: T9SS type A sorting domain-containing protein [Candidatus Latescibacterota bacterium]
MVAPPPRRPRSCFFAEKNILRLETRDMAGLQLRLAPSAALTYVEMRNSGGLAVVNPDHGGDLVLAQAGIDPAGGWLELEFEEPDVDVDVSVAEIAAFDRSGREREAALPVQSVRLLGSRSAVHPLRVIAVQPNPFNPTATVLFEVMATGPVQVRVFDAAGRVVRRQVMIATEPGEQRFVWDGSDESGRPVASGNYFFKLESAAGTATARATVAR